MLSAPRQKLASITQFGLLGLDHTCKLPPPCHNRISAELDEMLEDWSSSLPSDPMRAYRAKRDEARRTVQSKYNFLGFISSGTYGRVYKVQSKEEEDFNKIYAIKKFKPDKEGEAITYTGISQSAIREIAVCMIPTLRTRTSLTTFSPS